MGMCHQYREQVTQHGPRPQDSTFPKPPIYTHNSKTHNQTKQGTSLPGCFESTMDSDAEEEDVIKIFHVERKEKKK